jgi:hypothetical protein
MVQLDLAMNPYLFGCLVLLAAWLVGLVVVRLWRPKEHLAEFWWASLVCALLGLTEPLFVPEYWDPPSVLKLGRWDLESFLFCFAVGGITAIFPEVPAARRLFSDLSLRFWVLGRRLLGSLMKWLTGGVEPEESETSSRSEVRMTRRELTQDNMILAAAFMGAFGATAHLNLNVIYDAAIACVAMAVFIAWRRPGLRWQILSGGASFTLVYAIVLRLVGLAYPDFYARHWNLSQLSGLWILGAPAEEYLFALTLGFFWSPLYEAWKDVSKAPM